MTINLKDYENKLVIVTLRNEWMVIGLVNISEKYHNIPYDIDGRHYSIDGRCFFPANREHDIVDIVLADEDPCETPEKPKMKINLKDYAGKLVVATLRNEWMVVGLVTTNTDYSDYSYIFDRRCYTRGGLVLIDKESPYDIVDIRLADEYPCETPKHYLMTNCFIEGNPPNGCPAWSVWYEEFGSRGILNNLKISSVDYKPIPQPEPVITRVEVITDTGRDYVRWNKNNKITTSLQDDGKTLKVFVNKTTEEPEMPITKPEFYDNMTPGDKTLYRVAEKEVSKQWATALLGLIDELGGDSPALWEWKGITPTPEKVVEYLREHIKYLLQIAADGELEACLGLIAKRYSGCNYEGIDTAKEISSWMRNTRRPKQTLKSQALKDFETVRKHSDLLPEILDTIENALKSIPDEKGV